MMLISARGQAIRFAEKDVRSMGRTAAGVRGIRLKADDQLVGVGMIEPDKEKVLQVLTLAENGFGKRSNLSNYKVQNRGGGGIRTLKVSSKTGKVVKGMIIDSEQNKDNDIMVISSKGQVIRMPFKTISELGRDTQGVRLMRFKESKDKVVTFSKIVTDVKDRG